MAQLPKKSLNEIKVIYESPKRRPYASKINFELPKGLSYGFHGECCLLVDRGVIVRIKPEAEDNQQNISTHKHSVTIEGFATAGEAERMGLRLSMSLLWAAVSQKWPLRLNYHTPQPCMVYDRSKNEGGGFRISGSMTISLTAQANKIAELINEVLSKTDEIDPRLLISMELFASARLESTERAKFIGLVSSLEPLATKQPYNITQVENLVSSFIEQLNKIDNLPDNIKNSIAGRAKSLNNESISQAIARYVQSYFPDQPNLIKFVKETYDIRSSILHDGTFDADLEERGRDIEDIIRYIYSKLLGVDVQFPININCV
jgi:hypothetical protein